ncbi:transcription factor stalky [Morus notabilis]|uniref:transcription factor stalky n=1 Tax=Morus notabilis TaxID=981085 RepID=UPI000CED3FC5|nr:transcription factor stalky [Morus notabilis]
MQYWQYGHNNNMVSGDHNTGNNNMVINNTGGPNNNYFGRFNQTGINMGQITKRTGAEADQILSSMEPQMPSLPNSSSFNAIMNNRSSAFSPVPWIQLNDYNNIFLNPNTTGTIMNNVNGTRRKNIINGMKRKRGDDGDDQMLQAQAEAFVFDFGEEEEVDQDHDVVEIDDGDDANKCCSNIYCRTQTTPMWRRGPLGPKSLCNACGIKYGKQEGIWRALEIAAAKARNSSGTSNVNYLQ